MSKNSNKTASDWVWMIPLSIAMCCSAGAFADIYEIDGGCETIGNLVEIQNPQESEFNKYIDKSARVIIASVSNIVPTFSFEKVFAVECQIKQVKLPEG